jgi:ArsR family transcriptional regulator
MAARSKRELKKIFEMQCQICKSMSHPIRLEIVDLLSRQEMAASALLEALETSKANLSKHVNQLIAAGIVEQRKEGRQVYYRLPYPEIHEACSIMRSVLYRRLKQAQRLASSLAAAR